MDVLAAAVALVLILAILNVVPYYVGRSILLYSLRKYRSLTVPSSLTIRRPRLFGRDCQEIDIQGGRLRLVDWDGVTCPVRPDYVRYVHFYQERSSKGRRQWYPYVTLYSKMAHVGPAKPRRFSLCGSERGRGYDGVQLINHMQIDIKDYVLLRKYCRQEHIPVHDDYARPGVCLYADEEGKMKQMPLGIPLPSPWPVPSAPCLRGQESPRPVRRRLTGLSLWHMYQHRKVMLRQMQMAKQPLQIGCKR